MIDNKNDITQNTIHLNREELGELLNVTTKTVRNLIKDNELENRLSKIGYNMIGIYKKGKSYHYELIKEKELSEWEKICQTNNINKVNDLNIYCFNRLTNKSQTRTRIIEDNNINISLPTAKRFDNILVEEGYMEVVKETQKYEYVYKIKEKVFNCVYRYLDKQGNVLYVGKTNNLSVRNYQHGITPEDKRYMDHAVKLEYITLDTYDDCLIAELYFIDKLNPIHNIRDTDKTFGLSIASLDDRIWSDAGLYKKKCECECTYVITDKGLKMVKELEKEMFKILLNQ